MKKIILLFYIFNNFLLYSFYEYNTKDLKKSIHIEKLENGFINIKNKTKENILILSGDFLINYHYLKKGNSHTIDLDNNKIVVISNNDSIGFSTIYQVSIKDENLKQLIYKYNKINGNYILNIDLKENLYLPFDQDLTEKINSLEGLEVVKNARLIILKSIKNNHQILNLKPLKNLKSTKDSLDLSNRKVANYKYLKNLEYVGANLNLSNCSISSINFLDNLKYVGSDFNLSENNIESIIGINKLLKVEGSLYLNENKLNHIDAFYNLKIIGGDLLLSSNNITRFNGFKNLKLIKRNLLLDKKEKIYDQIIDKVKNNIYY